MQKLADISLFNSVADLQQLGNSVVGGFEQVDVGMLPSQLYEDLNILTATLIEGMTIQHERLKEAEESPLSQAECELFMDMQRRYSDKIPTYAERTKNLILEDY